jgi:hypothetical protein
MEFSKALNLYTFLSRPSMPNVKWVTMTLKLLIYYHSESETAVTLKLLIFHGSFGFAGRLRAVGIT